MACPSPNNRPGKGRKVRVDLRRNRSTRARVKDWSDVAREASEGGPDTQRGESVVPKGDLSRRRTVIVPDERAARDSASLAGTVVAMRGLFADVDDGRRVVACTVRRTLRTRLIDERHPVAIGDRVRFTLVEANDEKAALQGVIEAVEERRGQLRRVSGRRVHTIAANVDQAIIVSSAAMPGPKPELIDRYIVAALAGGITPVICMNKIDLDTGGAAGELLSQYAALGHTTLTTSAVTGGGIETLRSILKERSSVVAGQSGVGKSSLLNAVQPGLGLKVGEVAEHNEKGRHTTSTASLIRLELGGYVVDTPGIRSFDLSVVPRNEFEAYFVEFVPHVARCKFPDCTHIHEVDCAVKLAVERGEISPLRYESYVHMFLEPGAGD
ncbi:MAG: ribosome small subunit-dependent GTPase A [Planctomycetes bacterium]|nr:ribosome small subunit-dependent GTPase A [Planctomycetota bacterium]